MAPHILSIDLGTSGVKLALVRADGRIAASTARPIETRRIAPDGAEQDPEAIWQRVTDAAREVIAEAGGGEEVVGVALCSQFSSVVPVDRDGLPVGPLVLWMDRRGARFTQDIYARHPEAGLRWIETHGALPLPGGNDTLAHLLWLQHERPEVYARTHAFLEPMDYLAARLTGRTAANACTAFLFLLTDNRKPDAITWDAELVRLAGVDPARLPELVPVGSALGPVRPDVARALGVPPETPVFSGVNDTQAVGVGTAAWEPGRGGISIGTTGQLLAHVDAKQTDFENELVSCPSPVPGRYLVLAENGIAGRALEHFLRSVVFARDPLADHGRDDVFANLEPTAAAAAPGSGGLLCLPWLTGTHSPGSNPHVRGAFLNVSLETTRADFVRAVLEGVAFSLRWLLPAVEQFGGARLAELRFAGGGAESGTWSQILADVLDRPVLQLEAARHTLNRSMALLAFRELGLLELADVDRLCPVQRAFEPRAEQHETYARLFEQFMAALDANRPVFEALNG